MNTMTESHNDAHISDYELYHIYRKMWNQAGKNWFVRDSQPWLRMNQIRDRITDKRYIKRGENGKTHK